MKLPVCERVDLDRGIGQSVLGQSKKVPKAGGWKNLRNKKQSTFVLPHYFALKKI